MHVNFTSSCARPELSTALSVIVTVRCRTCRFLPPTLTDPTSVCSITHRLNCSYSEILTWPLCLIDLSLTLERFSVFTSLHSKHGRGQSGFPARFWALLRQPVWQSQRVHWSSRSIWKSQLWRGTVRRFYCGSHFSFWNRRYTLTGRRSCIQGQDSGWALH